MTLRSICGCGSEVLRSAYFLRGKRMRGLTIRAILLSTSHCAVLLVVAGRGSDNAVLLLRGTGYSTQGWRSGSPLTPMDVRMCCDRRSIEAEGNRKILKSFSISNIWYLFCLFKAGGRPYVFGLSRMVAPSDRYASQISTGLQIVTNVYINVNVLT